VLAQVQYGAPIHTQLNEFFATTAAFGERDGGAVAAARRLFAQAGVTPHDIDVAMIVEPFTVAVPLALEQYGFCALGEGGPFIESGGTRWPDGALPVNTHGGSNGEAFVHGVNHLPEAVRQLRGTACNQVANAQLAFVCGAISDPSGAVELGAAR
jgi:acetyl-CoA acetyltransferase